jgi:hypothetical protein
MDETPTPAPAPATPVVSVQATGDPDVGMAVMAISDLIKFENECQASGLSWPMQPSGQLRADWMGVKGKINTIHGDLAWIDNRRGAEVCLPIRCLSGYENWYEKAQLPGGVAVCAKGMSKIDCDDWPSVLRVHDVGGIVTDKKVMVDFAKMRGIDFFPHELEEQAINIPDSIFADVLAQRQTSRTPRMKSSSGKRTQAQLPGGVAVGAKVMSKIDCDDWPSVLRVHDVGIVTGRGTGEGKDKKVMVDFPKMKGIELFPHEFEEQGPALQDLRVEIPRNRHRLQENVTKFTEKVVSGVPCVYLKEMTSQRIKTQYKVSGSPLEIVVLGPAGSNIVEVKCPLRQIQDIFALELDEESLFPRGILDLLRPDEREKLIMVLYGADAGELYRFCILEQSLEGRDIFIECVQLLSDYAKGSKTSLLPETDLIEI